MFISELPIFTTKAHVFHIDPDTKKKWPLSTQAVNVSYYHDNGRHLYRIISVDGTKVSLEESVTRMCTLQRSCPFRSGDVIDFRDVNFVFFSENRLSF